MDQTFDEVVLGSFGDGPFVSVPKQTGPEAEGKLLPGLFGQGIMD